MRRPPPRPRQRPGRTAALRRSRGMVLIAVLWIVAALAVLVTGTTRAVRDDARVASLARQGVLARALGGAAIELVLQRVAASPDPLAALTVVDTAFRGQPVAVEIVPLNGLIDINNAPPALLAALLRIAGGVPAAAAESLAAVLVEARSQRDTRGRPIGFEASEDLLQVPGIDYTIFSRIAPLVTADLRGSGRVNPLAAPPDVLVVLAGGDAVAARSIAAARAAGRVGIDTTMLNAEFVDNDAVRRFRLRARTPLAGGGWALVSRTVGFEGNAMQRYGLPWRTYHSGWQIEARGTGT